MSPVNPRERHDDPHGVTPDLPPLVEIPDGQIPQFPDDDPADPEEPASETSAPQADVGPTS